MSPGLLSPRSRWRTGADRLNYFLSRVWFYDASRFGERNWSLCHFRLPRSRPLLEVPERAEYEGNRARSPAVSTGRLPSSRLPLGCPLSERPGALGGMAAFSADLDSQSSRPRAPVIHSEGAGTRSRRVAPPAEPREGGMGAGRLVLSMARSAARDRSRRLVGANPCSAARRLAVRRVGEAAETSGGGQRDTRGLPVSEGKGHRIRKAVYARLSSGRSAT